MEKRYYVYEWYDTETGEVFYIGKGTNSRYSQITGRNQFFIDFYNTHNCESRKVYIDLTEEEAFNKEIELIKYYKENTTFRLTNQTDGGEGHPFPTGELNPKFGKGDEIVGEKNPFYGHKHNERIRKILSEKASEKTGEKNSFYGRVHSEETKRKISLKAKERLSVKENNYMYGKTHSEEARRKISEAHKGRPLSEEQKLKISQTLKDKYKDEIHFNTGRKASEETRKKLREINKGEGNPNYGNGDKIRGEKNPMYGKQHSEETRRKMSERAQARHYDKICIKCGEKFVAKAHNAKKCPNCRPKKNKK